MNKVLALCLSASVFAAGAYAQATAGLGSVSGTVRDASGAVVPGATVIVTNDSKGIKRSITTTDAGVFAAPALVPATGYSLSVTKTGFSNFEVKAFDISVGQNVDFKVALEVGSAATKVDVTAEAPLVEDTKSGVTATVSKDQIDELPINGRRVDSFVLLTPAVTNDGEFGLLSFRGIAAGNAFLTDGNDTTNSFYNENAGRTRIGSQLSQDAVQEFQVLSNGFSAEFGRAMGGVINTVTKSGGNETHGTGYWFFRNRTLEAADRYSNGLKAPEWRHTAGASLGGTLKKDKLFYFFNFDYTDRNFPGQNRIVNNTITDPTGNFIPASNCIPSTAPGGPTQAQCTAAINFLQKQMNVLVPRTYNQELGFGKIDWRPTERNSFSFDLNAMRWVSPHGIQTQAVLTSGNMLGNNGNSTVQDKYGKASWTSVVTNSSVNELRFGWFKDRLSDPGASDLYPETGPVYITVAGATVGGAQAYPRTYPSENRYQIVENYTWTTGAHNLKFGADFQTTADWTNQLFNGNGGYSYTNVLQFAKDFSGNTTGLKNYTNFSQQFGNPIKQLRTTDINLYVQDTWKLTRKLTFGYGLRYEKSWLPQPTITNPDWPQTGKVPEQNKNFAPRISLSYSIDDRTVIRAGYGMFYARIHGNLLDTLFLGNGKYQTAISAGPSVAGTPVFPNILGASGANLPGGTISLQFADPQSFRAPYSQQGTLAVEHQFTRDIAVTASYIWSRGIGLFTQRDLNLGNPAGNYTYTILNTAGATVNTFTTPVFDFNLRPDKRYGRILQIENGGQSWYNALAVQVEKRFSHGLTGQINYTWSHAIDDANQQGASNNISSTFNNATYNGNYALDKGTSTLDQRHRLSVNWLWRPTFTTSTSAFSRYFVNGWELSGITTLASAHPVTTTVNAASTAANGVFPGVTLAYSTLNGSGGWNRTPFLPIGNLDIDQTYNVDARITRSIPFSEKVKCNLLFEAFNAFNTIHNTGVQQAAYNVSAGGILRPVVDTNGVSHVGDGSASQGFPDGTNARRMQVGLRFVF
ncbi:MAG TPA: carboxypeptidase regulatory-like domain-containing protein [Candidatus Acidoferrum sp.]|nr:carboxypeptidase regulatory-like domain-containing protein [Candidatus Acidoferrum sp.]